MGSITMTPIGVVKTGRPDVEDDGWDDIVSSIELDGSVLERDATDGLEAFSHIEVLFVFDRVDPHSVCTGARHPRARTDWPKVGILAQRAKDRPNRLGTTTCRLEAVDGLTLHVRGLDAVAGTPVLDIKPFMQGFAPRGTVEEPSWATELMAGYW